MNEMQSLSRLRDDIPAPSAAVLAGARAVLAERVGDSKPTPLRRRVSMQRRALVSLAAAAAVAAGAIAVTSSGHPARDKAAGGNHSTITTKAPPIRTVGYLLDQAAKRTVAAGDPVVPPGQYRYVKTHAWFANTVGGSIGTPPAGAPTQLHPTSGNSITFLSEQQYEVWVPADGTGTRYWRYTRPTDTKFFSAADKTYVEQNFPTMLTRNVENYTGADGQIGDPVPTTWGIPTPAWLAALPRDPAALLARLYEDPNKAGADVEKYDAAFLHIAQVLSSGMVPADLRAALYQVASNIPGVELIDSTANLDGRQGVAVGRVDSTGNVRQEILFDSAGGQYIGERQVAVRGGGDIDVPVGTAFESTAVTVEVAAHSG